MNKSTYEQPVDAKLRMEEAKMSRSEALATRLEAGASALAAFAKTLSEAEWETRIPKDGRKIGVVVHHVASVYPVEIYLASLLASGQPIAKGNDGATKSDTLALLANNSAAAANPALEGGSLASRFLSQRNPSLGGCQSSSTDLHEYGGSSKVKADSMPQAVPGEVQHRTRFWDMSPVRKSSGCGRKYR